MLVLLGTRADRDQPEPPQAPRPSGTGVPPNPEGVGGIGAPTRDLLLAQDPLRKVRGTSQAPHSLLTWVVGLTLTTWAAWTFTQLGAGDTSCMYPMQSGWKCGH